VTVQDVKALLTAADPGIRRFMSAALTGNYTIWEETGRPGLVADNRYAARKLTFEVRRYTRLEDDPTAAAIDAALDACPDIAYTWETSQVAGTDYIRHVFACEAILTD